MMLRFFLASCLRGCSGVEGYGNEGGKEGGKEKGKGWKRFWSEKPDLG